LEVEGQAGAAVCVGRMPPVPLPAAEEEAIEMDRLIGGFGRLGLWG